MGTQALENDAGPVVVARDGRLSGPYLMAGMIEGILSTGCDVLDIGAGAGDTTFIAAERVGPGGRVLAIDASVEATKLPASKCA